MPKKESYEMGQISLLLGMKLVIDMKPKPFKFIGGSTDPGYFIVQYTCFCFRFSVLLSSSSHNLTCEVSAS